MPVVSVPVAVLGHDGMDCRSASQGKELIPYSAAETGGEEARPPGRSIRERVTRRIASTSARSERGL